MTPAKGRIIRLMPWQVRLRLRGWQRFRPRPRRSGTAAELQYRSRRHATYELPSGPRYEKRGGQLVLLPTPPSLGIPRMQWIGLEAAGALLRHPEWEVIRP